MKSKLVREELGDQVYEYIPLGKHIVSAPGVCRGRPTFKHTRIEVAGILDRLAAGYSLRQMLKGFKGRFSAEAVLEAATLAGQALVKEAQQAVKSCK